MIRNLTFPFLLLSIFINTGAQLLLKLGMARIGVFQMHWDNLWPIFLKIAVNPFIIFGIICYMASLASWLIVLSRADLSYAYPMVSLGYILTTLGGYYWFGEELSLVRISGILTILLGVYLISRS